MRVHVILLAVAPLLAACGGGSGDSAGTPDNMVRVPTSTGAVPEAPVGPQFDPDQIEVTHGWLPSDAPTGEPVLLRSRHEKGETRSARMTMEAEYQVYAGGGKEPLQAAQARAEVQRRLEVLESIGEDAWRIRQAEDSTLDQLNTTGTWEDTGDADDPPTESVSVVDSLRRYQAYESNEESGPAGQLRAQLLIRVESVLPPEEARVGDQWRATARLGQSVATSLHTLTAAAPDPQSGNPMATIVSESTLTIVGPLTEVESDPESPFAQTTTNALTETVERRQLWDVARGRPVRAEFVSQSSVDLVAVPRGGGQGILVPLSTRIQRRATIEYAEE
jgi:hypothetical protein